jgi:hypothetical protein
MSLNGALRKLVFGWAAWAVGFVFISLGSMPMYAAARPVPTQVRVGSVPYDRVLALQLTLTSVTLDATDGSTTTIVSEPTDVEFTRLANDSEPLFVGALFPLSYTGVTITVGGGKVTYLQNGIPVEKFLMRSFTTTIRFRPAYALPYSASVLNLQLDIEKTVAFNGRTGGMNINKPVFNVIPAMVSSWAMQTPETGRVDSLVGVVTDVSDSSLTVRHGQTGANLTFATDENTQFMNASPVTLQGMTVALNGGTDVDGSLRATEVEALESSSGVVLQGLATGFPGDSETNVVPVTAVGEGVNNDVIATNTLIQTGAARFQIDAYGMDMTGLGDLQFDGSSFVPGQAVRVQSASPFQAGNDGTFDFTPADLIQLEPQSLTGTVANYQEGSTPGSAVFDLRLPNDGSSALRTLNPGLVSLRVYQQPGTELHDIAGGLRNGMKVQARGLLFFSSLPGSGSDKVFIMVVKQVSQ